jgi:hypothetical protein
MPTKVGGAVLNTIHSLAVSAAGERAMLDWLSANCQPVDAYSRTVAWTYNHNIIYRQVAFSKPEQASLFADIFSQYFVDFSQFTVVSVDSDNVDDATIERWCAEHCHNGCQYFVSRDVVFTPADPVHLVHTLGFSDPRVAMLCKLTYA